MALRAISTLETPLLRRTSVVEAHFHLEIVLGSVAQIRGRALRNHSHSRATSWLSEIILVIVSERLILE